MVQSYSDVIAKQKDIGSAKVLNPQYDVEVNEQQVRTDNLNAQNKIDSIQKYKDDLIAQGYTDQGNGVFRKKKKYSDGSSKTTMITIDSDGNVSKKVKKRDLIKTTSQPSQNVTVSVLPVATNISSGGLASMQVQEAYAKPINAPDSAYKPVSQIPELNKSSTSVSNVQTKSSTSVSSFTVPRTVSSSETNSMSLNVDVSNVAPVQMQSFGGTMSARRVGDYSTVYDQEGNRLTPTPTDLAGMKIVGALGGSQIVAGTVAGLLSPARLGETLYSASNLNPYSENQKATQSKIKQGVVEVVKDPFGKLVAEPIQTVANNPLYEAPKLATEIFLLEGASRGAKTIVKEVGSVNKYSGADVKASAYDLSRSSEQAQIFLKDNQINPSASGGNEFVPLPQLTVDVSQFNKNQRYFSDPQLDVGVDRQFTLAGTEVKPSLNKKGILPLDEVQVAPFESNPLTINVKKGGESRLTPFEYAGYLQEKYPKFDGVGFDVQSPTALGTTGNNIRGQVGVDVDLKLLDQPTTVQTFSKEMAKQYKKTQGENLNSLVGTKYYENPDTVLAHELVHAELRLQGKERLGTEIEAFTIMGKPDPEFLVVKPTEVRGASTILSRSNVDLPVVKSFNKDTVSGSKVVDLQNPDRSSFVSQDLKQSTLAPIENKVSTVPAGSNKPLIYERVKPVENKPVIDNSFAFVSDGSVLVSESSSGVSLPARSFGSEKRLKVNADYVYDSGSGEYIRKAGDVELNLDIKGKVTPQRFGVSPAFITVQPQVQEPSVISKIIVDPVQSPSVKSNLNSSLLSDPVVKPKTKITQIQSPLVVTDQFVDSDTEQKFSLKFGQDSIQRLEPRTLLKSTPVPPVELKPLLPTLRSERQVKSGSGLFDVLVRKEGKFVKVGSGYSDLATAFNRGKQEVQNTARASFKVVSRLGEVQRFNIGADRSLTRSKRDANVVVQKREFRISSEGEKTEISRKGVFTQKLRKSKIFK